MQSCTEGLFPLPYAKLASLFDKSKEKNTNFSTCTHLAYYTSCVYTGCTTRARIHRDLCPKMKNGVGFPCHKRRSLILGLPYTRNVLNQLFRSILKDINGPIPNYGKEEKAFNFERKVTLKKLFTSY